MIVFAICLAAQRESFSAEILFYAAGTAAIALGFLAVRLMLVAQSVSLTPMKLLLFPFFS